MINKFREILGMTYFIIVLAILLVGCAPPTPIVTATPTPTVQMVTLKQYSDDMKARDVRIDKLTTDLDKVNKQLALMATLASKDDLNKSLSGYASPAEVIDLKKRLAAVEGQALMYQSQLTTYQAQINAALKAQDARNAQTLTDMSGQYMTKSAYLTFWYGSHEPLVARVAALESKVK